MAPTAAPIAVPTGPATVPTAAPAATPPARAPTPVPTGCDPGAPVRGSRFASGFGSRPVVVFGFIVVSLCETELSKLLAMRLAGGASRGRPILEPSVDVGQHWTASAQ